MFCVVWKIVGGAGEVSWKASWCWKWSGILDHLNLVGPPGIPPVSPMASPPLTGGPRQLDVLPRRVKLCITDYIIWDIRVDMHSTVVDKRDVF